MSACDKDEGDDCEGDEDGNLKDIADNAHNAPRPR